MWKPKAPLSLCQVKEVGLARLIGTNKNVEPIRRSKASPATSLDVVRLIAESGWEEIVRLGDAIIADKSVKRWQGRAGIQWKGSRRGASELWFPTY